MASSSQVSWNTPKGEAALATALSAIGLEIEELPSQEWDPETATIGGKRDIDTCNILPSDGEWSSILLHLNAECGEPLARELSKVSNHPAVTFHEYDQSAWGFAVYTDGELTLRFWNMPDAVEIKAQDCSVDPKECAAAFGIDEKLIAPYLQQFDVEQEPGKAFDGDEFELWDHWVRCDFMNQLKIPYPSPGTPGARHIYLREIANDA